MTKFLWVLDPWKTLDHPKDTSLRLLQESLSEGHENWICDKNSIRLQNGNVVLDAQKALSVGQERKKNSFRFGLILYVI